MTEFAEELRALRTRPSAGASDDDFVARVMAACEGGRESAEPRRPSRRPSWGYGAALAAAACVAIGLSAWPHKSPHGAAGAFAARGSNHDHLAATVQAFVGHAAPGAAPPLLDGATLRPGDGILVRYSNPTKSDVYLMVFALDERGAVHWIHPAYLAESSNPTSLKLAPEALERVLPEVAEPESPAPGKLRVYALLSDAPLDVKHVEQKLAGSRRAVPELFSSAEVEEWSCTWAE